MGGGLGEMWGGQKGLWGYVGLGVMGGAGAVGAAGFGAGGAEGPWGLLLGVGVGGRMGYGVGSPGEGGGHIWGWRDPSGPPHSLQGDEPSENLVLHKATPGTPKLPRKPPKTTRPHPKTPPKPPTAPPDPPHLTPTLPPGFALLLARDAPHPPLLGGPSPPTEDEDLSPHAV